ncbi:MAG: hypothetical protein ACK4GQ_04465 [Candidatus Hadarchaeales archaeon]
MRILPLPKKSEEKSPGKSFEERVKEYLSVVKQCEEFAEELERAIDFYRKKKDILPIKSQCRHVEESARKVFMAIDRLSKLPGFRKKVGKVEVAMEDIGELKEYLEKFGGGAEIDAANKWYLEKMMVVVDRYLEEKKRAGGVGDLMESVVKVAKEAVKIDEKHEKITDLLAFGVMGPTLITEET